MTAGGISPTDRSIDDAPPLMLGGPAALAESEWMGVAQASDVLEPINIAAPRRQRAVVPRLPRLAGLLTREFTIAEASFVLMTSFFFSALLGAVRQVLFNAQFGAGSEASAYYAAFRLPDTLFSLIAGGALSSAMIPVLLSTSREEGEDAGWRLINLVLTTLLAVFALIVFVGELFTPALVKTVIAPGFDDRTSELTVELTRIMLLQPLILAVGSVAAAVLNSKNQFLLTALSAASHNVTLIAGILAATAYPNLGIYGPTLGVVAGAALQVAIMLPGLLSRNFRYRTAWNLKDRRLGEVIRLLIPNGLSVGVGYAGFILDTAFASKAPETAALPAIYNAWLLVGLPIALLGQAVGQSAFPRLAAHAAALEWSPMRRTLLRAFAAAGSLTYAVLIPYAVALPAYVGTEVITRGLIALRDTRTPLLTNSAQLAGRAAIITLLLGSVGVLAIPIAFAVTASVETVVLGIVLLLRMRRRMRAGAMVVP